MKLLYRLRTIIALPAVLLKLHLSFKAFLIKRYRTQEVVKAFTIRHAVELSSAPATEWPAMRARQADEIAAVRAGKLDIVDRRSWAWPWLPASINRLSTPIAKATPYNLRRLSRTPVPRRAINLIKNSVTSLQWDIVPIEDVILDDETQDQDTRIRLAKKVFNHPNNEDSFQTFMEKGIEDQCCFGAYVNELALTPDPDRPLKLWNVNVESVRIFAAWTESTPDMPHYAQMTGLKGERGAQLFFDDELMYVRNNPSTDNPFGLGQMEVAFASVNDFLGIQNMSGRAGTDAVHKTWLWWEQPQSDASYQIVRRHIQNELEGQAKVSLIGGMKKPEVIEVQPVSIEDILIPWQEMLIRMIANAFDMSALALGIEHDINRAVGEVLDQKDFRSAVVPTAKRIEEANTRKILHEKLGWYDLRFVYLNLDNPDLASTNEACSRMYSGNAITPNEWRKKMRMEPLNNPFADLTQFECMLLNIEAMTNMQNQSADKSAQRQLDTTQKMQDMQDQRDQKQSQQQMDQHEQMIQRGLMLPPGAAPPTQPGTQGPTVPGQPAGAGPSSKPSGSTGGQDHPSGGASGQGLEKMTPGTVSRGGQPPSPKALSLPKFPIAGSRYTAKQIAMMPLNRVDDMINSGSLPRPSILVKAMEDQEPGILEEMSDEVREFLETLIREEQQETKQKRKEDPKAKLKRSKDLAKKFKGDQTRSHDLSEYLYKVGSKRAEIQKKAQQGTTSQGLRKPGGRPGNLNPNQGL